MIESEHGIHYGFPLHDDGWLKIAKHHHAGEIVDPESCRPHGISRPTRPRSPARYSGCCRRPPGRSSSAKTCLYTMAPDGDFVIDRLPGRERIVVASPCSGHGFKFAPAIGQALAELVLTGRTQCRSVALPAVAVRLDGRAAARMSESDMRASRISLHRPATGGFPTQREAANLPTEQENIPGRTAMHGLMQDWPLLCHRILDHAAIFHPDRPIVSRSVEGPIHRTTYGEARSRALKVAQRLDRDGIRLGDRVATLAWNTCRHFEAWYGIMGIGAIYHTVNPRLFPDQIAWIINHAEDRVMMTDLTFVPLLEKLADKLPDDRALYRADRRRAYAGHDAEERGPLRRMDRRGRRRLRVEELRREYRSRHVLHLRHHRTSQGRALFASLQRAAFDDGEHGRRHGRVLARRHHAGGADVPRQLLGPGADRADERRRAGHARHEDGRRLDLPAARRIPRHLHRRGADHLADAAAASGGHRREAAVSQSRGDRRLGLSARHDREVREELRRQRHSCLGHDGNVAARFALHAQAGICGARRRGAARPQGQAGPSAVRRRDEDHRR